jgi:hypothetical protein
VGKTSTARRPQQTQIARFWYEGSAADWKRITRGVAAEKKLDPWPRAKARREGTEAEGDRLKRLLVLLVVGFAGTSVAAV